MSEFISAKNQNTCTSLLVFPILYQGSCSIPWKAAVAQVSYEAALGRSPESLSSPSSPSSTSSSSSRSSTSSLSCPSSPLSPSSPSPKCCMYHHYPTTHTITLVKQTWAGSWQTKGWSFLQITSSHSGLYWDHDHWPLTKYKLQILNKSCLQR